MPPDYSGYSPRQQQRHPQEPWANAAVGIAQAFMPNQETQLAARRFQQNEDLFQSRLLDAEVARQAAANRDLYEKKRLAQFDEHKALHEERGRILALAANENRDLTRAEAARLVTINGIIRGTVGAGEVSGFFALPEAKQRAADKAAEKEKTEAAKSAAAEKEAKDKLADKTSAEFKDRFSETYKPIDQERLTNNIMNFWNSSPYARSGDGFTLSRQAAEQLAAYAAAQGYTNAELMTAAKRILYGNDKIDDPLGAEAGTALQIKGERLYSESDIARFKAETPAAEWPTKEKQYRGMRRLTSNDLEAVKTKGKRGDGVLRVEGTRAQIDQFAKDHPGQRILFFDIETGRYGGGISNKSYSATPPPVPQVPAPLWLPWTNQ
jgi:hypothetical protein